MVYAPARAQHSALVLEDDSILASALREFLESEGWEVETAASAAEGRSKLAENVFDLVLADYLLPDADGITVFEEIQHRSPLTKVMLMTGLRDVEIAARAFKKGAADFISKPFQLTELEKRIEALMEEKRLQIEDDIKRVELNSEQNHGRIPTKMVGESPALKKVFRLVALVAEKDATVLVTGESGTGKELVARAIHERSFRKDQPFVAINCGGIPESLLEDELFGHVRGAYTDAHQTRMGKFEQAHGGTLFLDEIGNMPLPLQIKLLRVLQEKEFQKLGSNQTVRVDIRIVAATNADLQEKVRAGEFRADLFYRLNVVPIHLPPLRERKEDLLLLVNHLLKLHTREHALPTKKLAPGALKRLMEYQWPGNIRELSNAIELACVLSGDGHIIGKEHLPILQDQETGELPVDQPQLVASQLELPEKGIDLNQVVTELERNLIYQSLRRTGGNKGKAARLLYLKRTTLVEKLRRLDLLEDF